MEVHFASVPFLVTVFNTKRVRGAAWIREEVLNTRTQSHEGKVKLTLLVNLLYD